MLKVCSLLVLMCFGAPVLADISGVIRVKDGDTFDVGGQTVRLHGIDAPETDQFCGGNSAPVWPCGGWAAGEVRARYQGKQARCEVVDVDRYDRAVARCFVDGQDVGRALVLDGLAFAFRRYSMDYDLDEKAAAVNLRGLHSAGVQSPAAYRSMKQDIRTRRNAAEAPEGCTIKGNISSDGKRIYHVAGQVWYGRTTVNPAQGERWFCTEREAQAAGWRRAKK